jgi:hypothetical protein
MTCNNQFLDARLYHARRKGRDDTHSVFVELLSFKYFVHTTLKGPNKGGALSTCNTEVELEVRKADIGGLRQCQMVPMAEMQDLQEELGGFYVASLLGSPPFFLARLAKRNVLYIMLIYQALESDRLNSVLGVF